jgi:hypothetical protein
MFTASARPHGVVVSLGILRLDSYGVMVYVIDVSGEVAEHQVSGFYSRPLSSSFEAFDII